MVRHAADAEGRAVGILADLQGPKIRLGPVRGGPGGVAHRRGGADHRRRRRGHPRPRLHHLQGPRRRRPRRRPAARRRRQGRPAGHRRRGHGRGLPRHRGRAGQRQQGPLAAGHERLGARACPRRTSPTWSSPSSCGSTSSRCRSCAARPTSTSSTRSWTSKGARLPVIAKLEKPEAVDNLEAIVLAFDGVMVARGDLGVELPLEHVPLVQKRAIQIARENAKPVIVATQMLESMITQLPPDPRRGVRRRQRGARRRRRGDALRRDRRRPLPDQDRAARWPQIVEAVEDGLGRRAARCSTCRAPSAACSPTPRATSASGSRPARSSPSPSPATPCAGSPGCTPALPLLAFTPVPEVRSQLALSWGVETFLVDFVELHRRDGPPGRPRDAVDRAGSSAATSW